MPVLRQWPGWAWIGGGVLAFVAGIVNAAGHPGFRHQAITHLNCRDAPAGFGDTD